MVAISAIQRLASELYHRDKPSKREEVLIEVVHLAIDTLHRYVLNLGNRDNEIEPDWFMVGLACFFIGSKVNSVHFGGAEILPHFYYQNRIKPQEPHFKNRNLVEFKTDVRTLISESLNKVEFDILSTLNF